jgi:hypothetical protein
MKLKQTLKIGQRYRVIHDVYNNLITPRIVKVAKIGVDNSFFDENDYFYDMESCMFKLQLITPKKKSKEIKSFKVLFNYSRECEKLHPKQTDEFKQWVKEVTDTINLLIKNK